MYVWRGMHKCHVSPVEVRTRGSPPSTMCVVGMDELYPSSLEAGSLRLYLLKRKPYSRPRIHHRKGWNGV